MKLKRIFSAFSAVLVFSCSFALTTNAVTTVEVDNDTIASGCSNGNSGFIYITDNSLYNGDARESNPDIHCEYRWYFPNQISSGNCTKNAAIFAYLDYDGFTDTEAKYYLNDGASRYNVEYMGYINQNIASRGWNYVAKTVYFSGVSTHAEIRSSDKSGECTGADAIRVSYY